MMCGGNILVLQQGLGHINLTETVRYAHLVLGHLQKVVKLNPLSALTDATSKPQEPHDVSAVSD